MPRRGRSRFEVDELERAVRAQPPVDRPVLVHCPDVPRRVDDRIDPLELAPASAVLAVALPANQCGARDPLEEEIPLVRAEAVGLSPELGSRPVPYQPPRHRTWRGG